MSIELRRGYAQQYETDAFWTKLASLRSMVWPSAEPIPMEEFGSRIKERYLEDKSEILTVWKNDEPIACGRLFARQIMTQKGPLTVGALASVLTRPDLQGNGYGRMIVQAACERVADSTYPLILFQTSVPAFYEKLGAREIFNRFSDSTSKTPDANPWRSGPHIMIYPASYPWPDGDIDLCGYGY